MNRAAVVLGIWALALWSTAFAESGKKTAPLPRDLSQWLSRMEECDHWAGEEPYDKARAEEIGRAEQQLKCGSLESEKKALQKKYKGKSKVLKKFDEAIAAAREGIS